MNLKQHIRSRAITHATNIIIRSKWLQRRVIGYGMNHNTQEFCLDIDLFGKIREIPVCPDYFERNRSIVIDGEHLPF